MLDLLKFRSTLASTKWVAVDCIDIKTDVERGEPHTIAGLSCTVNPDAGACFDGRAG